MSDIQNLVSQDELAEIESMLGDLTMPDGAAVEAAAEEPDTIIEPADEPIVEATVLEGTLIEATVTTAETHEIADTVAAIEAEAAAEDAELAGPVIEGTVSEAGEVELDLSNLDEAVRGIEAEEARTAAYAEQEAVPEDETVAAVEPGTKPARKPRTKKAAATATPAEGEPAAEAEAAPAEPKAPRTPRATLAELPDTAFLLDDTVDPEDAGALAANRAAVMARRPAQVKVAEKFDNVLLQIAAGRAPSTYTLDCYRVLKASGRTTSAALAAALTATTKKGGAGTYTIGTARSQSGQFMALAPALRIATREAKELVLNPDSLVALALDALIGA